MRSIAKATAFIVLIVAVGYLGGYFAAVPLAADATGLPRVLALNAYDMLYRPVRKQLPYRNLVRTYWRKYLDYWCEGHVDCPLYGDKPQGGGLFQSENRMNK